MTSFLISDRYKTEKTLGQGHLSTVYCARDLQTDQTVALKILQPHLRDQPVVVQRFKREMAAVQRLDHQAIIRIFEVIETPEHLALVMEYAPGQDLKSWLRNNGPMPAERVINIAKTLLEAIEQAHRRGIIHRDLSLNKILLDEQNNDHIEIIGFGLARVDELVGLTMHTRVLGTLETMAPECILGQPITTQAEIFSIGAMLYQLVTGLQLHDGRMNDGIAFATRPNYLDHVQKTLDDVLEPAHKNLKNAILRALAPDPALRFATAAQCRNALLGNYNPDIWTDLENMVNPPCPQCQRPLIQSVNHCVYCKHTISRLIERPGEGDFIIQIISPYQAFKADVWFETNLETDILTEQQVRALHELLFAYHDTSQVFQARADDMRPPYILFDELTAEDADRVGKLLKARNIPFECLRADDFQRLTRGNRQKLLTYNPNLTTQHFEVRNTPPPNTKRYLTTVKIIAALCFFVAFSFSLLPLMTGQPMSLTITTFAIFFAMTVLQLIPNIKFAGSQNQYLADLMNDLLVAQNQNTAVSHARISGWAISQHHQLIIDNVLPPSATQNLLSLTNPDIQKQFHDVLHLTVQVFHVGNVPVLALRENLEPMLDHAAAILQRLTVLNTQPTATSPKSDTNELFNQVTLIDIQLEDSVDVQHIERLIQKRTALLEQMARYDAAIYETNLLQSQLLRVRASLLDLQTQFSQTQTPSLERITEEIDNLKFHFEAEREVLEIVGQS